MCPISTAPSTALHSVRRIVSVIVFSIFARSLPSVTRAGKFVYGYNQQAREVSVIQCFCGMVHDAGRRGFLGASWAPESDAAAVPKSAGPADAALIQDLVDANHI